MTRQYILTVFGEGPCYTLSDADLWGLECALQHGLQDGYFNWRENDDWARSMLERIGRLRRDGPVREGFDEKLGPPVHGEAGGRPPPAATR